MQDKLKNKKTNKNIQIIVGIQTYVFFYGQQTSKWKTKMEETCLKFVLTIIKDDQQYAMKLIKK